MMVYEPTLAEDNNKDMWLDFSYIDDVVAGILNTLPNLPMPNEHGVWYKVYNIATTNPSRS